MTEQTINLGELTALPELFKDMIRGRHIGRLNDSALWNNLEEQADQYTRLFAALGMDLQIDPRGFAWLENPREDQPMSKRVREIALVLLLIYEYQASQGHSLEEFDRWHIDHELLRRVQESNRDLLETERIPSADELATILKAAVARGFARVEDGGWRLLPAVRRFTDRFEALAAASAIGGDDAGEDRA